MKYTTSGIIKLYMKALQIFYRDNADKLIINYIFQIKKYGEFISSNDLTNYASNFIIKYPKLYELTEEIVKIASKEQTVDLTDSSINLYITLIQRIDINRNILK